MVSVSAKHIYFSRVGATFVAIAIGITGLQGAVASAQTSHYRWPFENSAVNRSYDLMARRRAEHRSALIPKARASIVGGNQIPITEAPWQAEIYAKYENGDVVACGGVIFGSAEVITAAHCTFDLENGERLVPSDFVVVTGIGRVTAEEIKDNPNVQARFVSEVRVHPMFEFTAGPGASDDVAVLTLKESLTFDSSVQAIKYTPEIVASELSEETKVNLTGFGPQRSGKEPNHFLYSLGMSLEFPGKCGGEANAVFLCASVSTGSGCGGDGGSALTQDGNLSGLLATVEIVSGEACQPGATNGFVNFFAPEIREFIGGSKTPPRAPRGGGASIQAVPQVGQLATCEPGSWTGSPTFTYSFIDSANGQTLQSGSSATYQLTTEDVGRTIYCEVSASNAGGTGVARTAVLSAVVTPLNSPTVSTSSVSVPTPGSPSVVSLVGTNLAVQRSGGVTVKLSCKGSESCSGKLTLMVEQGVTNVRGKKSTRSITIGQGSFSIAGGETVDAKPHLNRQGLALLKKAHGWLAVRLQIIQTGVNHPEIQSAHLIESAPRTPTERKK